MVRLTSPPKKSTLLGTASEPLELRVTNAPLAGQIVQLHGSKCTIGSGRRCTLRLQARRVEPVHCLILRGERGTVVRRWATNTRLNGAAFTDALLQPGDRLTIGPIVLEVLGTGRALEAAQRGIQQLLSEAEECSPLPTINPSSTSLASNQAAEAARREIAAQQAELTGREAALAQQEAALLAESSAWQAERRARQAELDELKHALGNAQQLQLDLPVLEENHQRLETELVEKQALLESQQERLQNAQKDFQASLVSKQDALARRRGELEEQASSLELQREKLAAEQATFATQQQAASEAFERREAELNQRQLDLNEASRQSTGQTAAVESDIQRRETDWQAAQAAWASERSVWQTTCQQTSDDLLRQEQALQQQREALESKQSEWERENSLTQEKLAEQQQALEELNQTLHAKQERLDAQQNDWEQHHTEQTARLEEQKAALETQAKELQDQRAAFETETATSMESSGAESLLEAEQEAWDGPAFEPAASVSETLASFAKDESPAKVEVETEEETAAVVETVEQPGSASENEATEQEATGQAGIDHYELSDEPTELEPGEENGALPSNLESAQALCDSAELVEDAETPAQPRSLAEQLFGISATESNPQAVEDQAETTVEERSHAYEPAIGLDGSVEEADSIEPSPDTQSDTDLDSDARDTTDADTTDADTTDADTTEELKFSESPKASPAESSGLMERLRAMADWDEDEAEDQQEESSIGYDAAVSISPRPASLSESFAPSAAAPSNADDEDEEESIEDYMAKMMVRIRGEAGQGASVQRSSKPASQPVHGKPDSSQSQASPVAAEAEPEIKSTEPQQPFEMAPRATPVELTSNLTAMRELANSSAREAIDLSVRNRWSQASVGKFSVAILALVSAGLLFHWSADPMSIPFLGAGVALLISIFWGLQGAIIWNGVRRATQAAESDEESAKLQRLIFGENAEDQADANQAPEAIAELESATGAGYIKEPPIQDDEAL